MERSYGKKRTGILIGVLGLLAFALLTFQTPFLKEARHWTWDWWVAFTARVGSIGAISVHPDVMTQLQELRSENTRLTSELRRTERLRLQLGRSSYQNFRVIPAEVAIQPLDTFGSQYFLNRGAADGVTLHAPVVVYGSTLVGFVTELAKHSSVVQMLFHPQTTFPVEVLTNQDEPSPIRGLVQGVHFTSVALTLVPRDRKITAGMPIVTSAQEGVVPFGLVVGAVDDLRSDKQDAYQSAAVKLPYDVGSLEALHILVPLVQTQ